MHGISLSKIYNNIAPNQYNKESIIVKAFVTRIVFTTSSIRIPNLLGNRYLYLQKDTIRSTHVRNILHMNTMLNRGICIIYISRRPNRPAASTLNWTGKIRMFSHWMLFIEWGLESILIINFEKYENNMKFINFIFYSQKYR